ncbi:Toprim domain-containing protein [Bosea lupini]|uniref:Toprim domain-containing protein n=1 Tax=Bosea lupini TaxID=1036779 RepID=A0A1H7GDS3_9HYPH|nr:toprim domain-containing protein [Bosea lupini]SEK36184.1 Toprim domain-containing protein [Bosea lupini]
MTARRWKIAEVKALLQERIEELCERLIPTGQHKTGYYLARNPHRDDKKPSLVIATTKREPGAWKDWGAETYRGDVLDLIQFVERLTDTRAAMKWALGWLGKEDVDPEQFRRVTYKAIQGRQRKAEDEMKRLKKDRGRALGMWLAARKDFQPEADRYFRARHLDLSRLPKWPGAIRFEPKMPYSQLAVRDQRGGIVRPAPELPCITTLLTDRDNLNGALHRIYLNVDCTDKVDLGLDPKGEAYPPRLCWPAYSGFVGRIWNGDGDMPIRDAIKHGVVNDLVICEGVEDALAVAISEPSMRVWAAISLSNLAHCYIDLPCIGDVFVWADNDWGKPQAMKALDAALAALKTRAVGRRIEVVRAPGARNGSGPKDANDLIGA